MTIHASIFIPPQSTSPEYLPWSRQFSPSTCEEGGRANIVRDLAHNASTVLNTQEQALNELVLWMNALDWSNPPAFYFQTLNMLDNAPLLKIQEYWQKRPDQRFRFELMNALHNEISHTTIFGRKMAVRMGKTWEEPLKDFLTTWAREHAPSNLEHAKKLLDTFYTPPEDDQNRGVCEEYAMAMFRGLNDVFKHESNPHILDIPLPSGL